MFSSPCGCEHRTDLVPRRSNLGVAHSPVPVSGGEEATQHTDLRHQRTRQSLFNRTSELGTLGRCVQKNRMPRAQPLRMVESRHTRYVSSHTIQLRYCEKNIWAIQVRRTEAFPKPGWVQQRGAAVIARGLDNDKPLCQNSLQIQPLSSSIAPSHEDR